MDQTIINWLLGLFGALITYNFDFAGVPLSFTKGDAIYLKIDRQGAHSSDTNSDDLLILGANINYKSSGPTSPGSGTYDVPVYP